jgi:hypothetical protein
MFAKVIKTTVHQDSCGCQVTYSFVEVEPGKHTVLSNPEFCDYHDKKYWDDKIKSWEEKRG